ncbi:hypothetical protein [Streptomyces sp. NPDC048248]|uniref:hypothetical protein n=1 Tax=Streptomyces sp. NPDC048248 TaxID=3365523 RepID=UPI00371CA3D3
MLAAHGTLAAPAAAAGVAVQFRHLQEISHAAVHGVLAHTARANLLLAEVFAHLPLGLGPVALRRRRHVPDHYPHATQAAAPTSPSPTGADCAPAPDACAWPSHSSTR